MSQKVDIPPKNKEPYYPYYNPALHPVTPPTPRDFSIPMNRYETSVYPGDKTPYYGSGQDYRKFNVPDIPAQVLSF